MALRNSFGLNGPRPTQLQLLLDEIRFQQQKELHSAIIEGESSTGGASNFSRGTTFWTDVFVRHFLFQTDRSIDADDLLFFVRKKHVRGSVTLPKFQTNVEVFRKDSKKLPIGDPEIEWQDTVFLNLLIHHLEYTLTLAICTRTSPRDLQVLKRHSQKVYASPSRRRMDTKGDLEEITYPFLSFMVDNFDEVYKEMPVRDGEMVCVELVASDRDSTGFNPVEIFLGSIRYDAVKKVYDSRTSLGSKMAQRMTFGLFSGSHQRVEYVRLKGPYGKGYAEVAVSKPKGAGCETPTSEPGFCMTDGMWDSDAESDSEDFVMKHHRRLSDPSSNLTTYARPWGRSIKNSSGDQNCTSNPTTNAKRTRSQNEGLDYCGLAEIEAGDVRDDGRNDDVSCCGCCTSSKCLQNSVNTTNNFDTPPFTDPYLPNNDDQYQGTTSNDRRRAQKLCCCPNPFPRSQSYALDNIPLSPITKTDRPGDDKELSSSYYCKSGTQTLTRRKSRRHPLIPSKTVIVPPTHSPSLVALLSTQDSKAISIACLHDAKLVYRDRLLATFPNKLASTGVRILYLCDGPKDNNATPELDDGAYNPLWTMRGFTQTFHVWREHKRASSVPLNAFLTYISLPCSTIMKDILENREEPVLTF